MADGGFSRSDFVAAEVHARLAGAHALLLTDFDGTLAELAPTPPEAVMTSDVREQITVLAALDSVTVGVVSGRRLFDVRSRVGPAAEFAAGLHGLEIMGPTERFFHPSLEAVVPIVQTIARAAERELAWCRGVLIEDKTFAITCHVRLATPEDGERALDLFEAIAEAQIERGMLRLLPGAKAAELVPAADWHKGRAVAWIRDRLVHHLGRPVRVIYLGDDRTDEDAFTALDSDDLAIGVGSRPHSHLIDWRLAGPASVGRFFERLAARIVVA
jgi:trehalose-phosphatase